MQEFLTRIENMLASGDYDWAQETLDGIYNTVETRDAVTINQIEAVENINEAGE